jgi:hypothetical protein
MNYRALVRWATALALMLNTAQAWAGVGSPATVGTGPVPSAVASASAPGAAAGVPPALAAAARPPSLAPAGAKGPVAAAGVSTPAKPVAAPKSVTGVTTPPAMTATGVPTALVAAGMPLSLAPASAQAPVAAAGALAPVKPVAPPKSVPAVTTPPATTATAVPSALVAAGMLPAVAGGPAGLPPDLMAAGIPPELAGAGVPSSAAGSVVPESVTVGGDPASIDVTTNPLSVGGASEVASVAAASEPAALAAASEPASVATALEPGSFAAAGNPEAVQAAAEPLLGAASDAASGGESTVKATAPTGVNQGVSGPNNNQVSVLIASDGAASQPTTVDAPIGAVSPTPLAPGSNGASVRLLSDGDNPDVHQSNGIGPSNNYVSSRTLSNGNDGNVYQENTNQGTDSAVTVENAITQANPVGGVPNEWASVQPATAAVFTNQVAPSNNYLSTRVSSSGDDGDVYQSTSNTGGDAYATNRNATDQSNGTSAAPALLGSDANTNSTAQEATAFSATSQIAPSNNYGSERVMSDGNDGTVNQSHSNIGGDAHALNENTTGQSTWQAGPGGGQAVNTNSTVQGAHPMTEATQFAPTNTNLSTRTESNGNNGDVTQSSTNQAGDAYASNVNQTTQSNSQQGAGDQGLLAENRNETTQQTDAFSVAEQDPSADQSSSVRVLSDGSDGNLTQSQSNAVGDAYQNNSNTTSQSNQQNVTNPAGIGGISAANDDKTTQSNVISDGCNPQVSSCQQRNSAVTNQSNQTNGQGATATNNAEQHQTNQISGSESMIMQALIAGNNEADFCNAEVATNQCRQTNDGSITQSSSTGDGGQASNSATQQQANQISGRDSTLGTNPSGDGDNAAGLCNAAFAQDQCRQENNGAITQDAQTGAGGQASNTATQQQSNQISGRDSTLGDHGAGSGNNGTGICNAATAQGQCRQQNGGAITQSAGSGPGGQSSNTATQQQSNQIAGRDSTLGQHDSASGDSGTSVCNAATAQDQCRQGNQGAISQGASTGAGGQASNTATQQQLNQISGRDSASGTSGPEGQGGNSSTGVCNAATAQSQCRQQNDGSISQNATAPMPSGGGPGGGGVDPSNTATQSQSNQISGRDSTTRANSTGDGDSATGVCNAATAQDQCRQDNRGEITQNASGGTEAWNSAKQSQSNQISGRDSALGEKDPGAGASAAGVCNAAEANNQCRQGNQGTISQNAQTGAGGEAWNSAQQSQTNQISGRDSTPGDTGAGSSAAGVCNAGTAQDQCRQQNHGTITQNAAAGQPGAGGQDPWNSATQSQSNQISGRDSTLGGSGSGDSSTADVCNADGVATNQCRQQNYGTINQTAQGGQTWNSAQQSQSNQISGRDSTLGRSGSGDAETTGRVCNAGVAENQCRQQNYGTISQTARGREPSNSAQQSQTNQISGPAAGTPSDEEGGTMGGVCTAQAATNQCRQQNYGAISQRPRDAENTARQRQSNEINGVSGSRPDDDPAEADSAAVCSAAVRAHQCEQTNIRQVSPSTGEGSDDLNARSESSRVPGDTHNADSGIARAEA